MAESYAKHLDRLEHNRHAKRERRQVPITRTCRRHHLQREHRDAHVHHAGEDRASVATGGAQQGSEHRGAVDVLSMAEARITALVCSHYTRV